LKEEESLEKGIFEILTRFEPSEFGGVTTQCDSRMV